MTNDVLQLIELYWIQPLLWMLFVLACWWMLSLFLRGARSRPAWDYRSDEEQITEVFEMTRNLLVVPVPYATVNRVIKLGQRHKEVTVTVKDWKPEVVPSKGLGGRQASLQVVN